MLMANQLIGFGGKRSSAAAATADTWDAATKSSHYTLSVSDRRATADSSGASSSLRSVTGKATGKWYAEINVIVGGYNIFGAGVCKSGFNNSASLPSETNAWAYRDDGRVYAASSIAITGLPTLATNDIVGIAIDASAGKLWFAKNNTWLQSGDPASATTPQVTGLSGTFYLYYFSGAVADAAEIQSTLTYTPPTGFSLWGL